MDLVIAVSGFFAAASLVWIVLTLMGALILGAVVAGIFGSIFYGANRLARRLGGEESSADRGAGIPL